MNSFLQSCKQLDVIGSQLPRQSSATPFRLGEGVCVWCACVCVCVCVCIYIIKSEMFHSPAEAMGVNQHHDAVT